VGPGKPAAFLIGATRADEPSKTQVALEYAYRRSGDDTCSVFWVHADSETTFTHDYKLIAKKLGVADGLDGEEVLTAVREQIERGRRWVLILDNADDLGLFGVGQTPQRGSQTQVAEEARILYDFIPRGPTGTVLWTSRDEHIAGTLVGAQRAINIARMTTDEAKKLLETVRNEKLDDDEGDATPLLVELDWLPLAISQAAAYMRRTSTPIREYLSKLKRGKKRWRVLQETEFDRHRRREVSNSILETWNISIEHIRQENEMAYNILHVLAFVDNQNIPSEMITRVALFVKEKGAMADRQCNRSPSSGVLISKSTEV
jgi:hypothetical protein